MKHADNNLIWPALDIAGGRDLLRSGEVGRDDLTAAHQRRTALLDPDLNVTTALLRVSHDDSRVIAPGGTTLRGIPIGVKDNISMRGVPMTAGCAALSGTTPDADATVVRRLRRSGADVVFRTNLDELALGGTTDNPVYGRTRSPWDGAGGVGGSSGGSAAAVAAGMCMAAIGTDTGGSVRNPAALCGVVGFKPTYGAIDIAGVLPLAWSLDTVGVLCHTVQDVLQLFLAIADERVVGTNQERTAWRNRFATVPRRRPRIGVIGELFDRAEQPTHSGFAAALGRLSEVADLAEVEFPGLNDALVATRLIVMAEAATAFGNLVNGHWSQLGPAVRGLLDAGTLIGATDYIEAQRLRKKLGTEVSEAVDGFDAVVSPTTGFCPGPAALAAAQLDGDGLWQLATRYTCLWNLTGSPALALPCGFTGDGWPLSLQIACPPGQDLRCLRVAQLVERALNLDRHRLEPPWVRDQAAVDVPRLVAKGGS